MAADFESGKAPGHDTVRGGAEGPRGARANRRMFLVMLAGAMLRRRSKALMAVVASFVGSATLFCLVLVCMAVPGQMTEEMQAYGANLVVTDASADGSGMPQSTVDDVIAAVGAVGAERHATYRYETVRVHAASYVLAGMDPAATEAIDAHWTVDGSWPGQGDAHDVMVGRDIADLMNLSVGSTLEMSYHGADEAGDVSASDDFSSKGTAQSDILGTDDLSFRVCGIIDTGGEEDSMIYADEAVLDALGAAPRGTDAVEFSLSADDAGLGAIVDSINSRASELGASARKVTRISASNERILSMLNALFWIVSLVVLALTLIGVATTVMSIVSQRRTEIALRKALGASRRSLSAEFYAESALYGLAGGALGVAAGYAVACVLTDKVFERTVGFSWPLCVLSLAVAVLVAVLASIAPVRRASRIDPAVVLREE